MSASELWPLVCLVGAILMYVGIRGMFPLDRKDKSMKKMTANDFIELLEPADVWWCVPQEYSGRGMYGKTCLAFTLDCDDSDDLNVMRLGAQLMAACQDEEQQDALIRMLGRVQTDQLGKGHIYYWPSIPWKNSEAEELARAEAEAQ